MATLDRTDSDKMTATVATVSPTGINPGPEMTSSDRHATEAYAKALARRFVANQADLWRARAAGAIDTYLACTDVSRSLYREISEVAVALRIGRLPV